MTDIEFEAELDMADEVAFADTGRPWDWRTCRPATPAVTDGSININSLGGIHS